MYLQHDFCADVRADENARNQHEAELPVEVTRRQMSHKTSQCGYSDHESAGCNGYNHGDAQDERHHWNLDDTAPDTHECAYHAGNERDGKGEEKVYAIAVAASDTVPTIPGFAARMPVNGSLFRPDHRDARDCKGDEQQDFKRQSWNEFRGVTCDQAPGCSGCFEHEGEVPVDLFCSFVYQGCRDGENRDQDQACGGRLVNVDAEEQLDGGVEDSAADAHHRGKYSCYGRCSDYTYICLLYTSDAADE